MGPEERDARPLAETTARGPESRRRTASRRRLASFFDADDAENLGTRSFGAGPDLWCEQVLADLGATAMMCRPVLSLDSRQVVRAVHQRHVGERLREVPQL